MKILDLSNFYRYCHTCVPRSFLQKNDIFVWRCHVVRRPVEEDAEHGPLFGEKPQGLMTAPIMNVRTIVVSILCLLAGTGMRAGAPYQFVNINTQNSGLSYDGIQKITQDSRGFIWVGTSKGLSRYDGETFRVYDRDDLGLISDYIFCIEEDLDGNIWVGTDNGVSRYDYRKDRFEPFTKSSDKETVMHNKVTFMSVDRDGSIWFLVNNQGVFNYDPAQDRLRMIPYASFGEGINDFRKMLHLRGGGFLLSSYHLNLFQVDEDFGNFRKISLDGAGDLFLADEVEGLFERNDGQVYVASTKNGLSVVDMAGGKTGHVFSIPDKQTLVGAFMSGDDMWLSTTGGVWRCNLISGQAVNIRYDGDDVFSIPSNYVTCTFVDKDGGVWIGTKDNGISYCGTEQNLFGKYVMSDDGVPLRGAIVRGLAEDGFGHIWVATEQRGLFRYDMTDGSLRSVCGLAGAKNILSTCCTSPYLWIGTLDGMLRLDVRNGNVKNYGVLGGESNSSDPRVYSIFKTRAEKVYAATTLGVFTYDSGSDSFVGVDAFRGIFMTGMAEDTDGTLWFASYANGVFRWNPGSSDLPVRYSSTSGNGLVTDKISSVFIDSRGDLWVVGFSHGFAKFDRKTGSFRIFDRESVPSLPSDVYFRMLEDANGRLWLLSDKGLVRLNPESDNVAVYTAGDGLLDNKFSKAAVLSGQTGEFFLGSDNGFVKFSPSDLCAGKTLPRVVLTGLMAAGRNRDLGENVDLVDRIVLSKDENSFEFTFSLIGASALSAVKTQCRLNGYGDAWTDVTESRSTAFYNVPAGEYVLEFRSSANGDDWKAVHKDIVVSVRPGFWGSVYGILLLISIIALLAFGFAFAYGVRTKRREKAKSEAYLKSKEEEAFQDKMNFFSHVIHEIKTPLTLIRTPLVNVLSKDGMDEEARKDLLVMKNSTDYLSRLVNELLDFVRVERKGFVMHPESIDIVKRIQSMIFDYDETARNSNIALTLVSDMPSAMVFADRSALDKILNNILLNAIKNAETRIEISIGEEHRCVELRFTNDGNRISEDKREEVFKPFVQIGGQAKEGFYGVGIGLPLARNLARMLDGELVIDPEPEDTCFVLTIPLEETGADAVAMEGDEGGTPENQDFGKPQILVVDDNPELRRWLEEKLSEDYSVLTASNGEAAMKMVLEQNVDLVLTDISMPKKNGLEICREIRENVEVSHLPVIILSARTSVESRIQAMDYGADLYVEKPFELEYLRSSIRNILEKRALLTKALSRGLSSIDVGKFGLQKRESDFIMMLDNLIKDNLTKRDLTTEWIAEKMNMSNSSLQRKMRKLMNTTMVNYVRTIRCSVAAEMVRHSEGNNITEICYAVGFSSPSYFTKCFKAQYGMTPSEYAEAEIR